MTTAADKKVLWGVICQAHPEFAKALRAHKGQTEAFVSIEGYAAETVDWIRKAIRAQNPELENEIKTVLEPRKTAMQPYFSPEICVRISDVIDALLKECQSSGKNEEASAA